MEPTVKGSEELGVGKVVHVANFSIGAPGLISWLPGGQVRGTVWCIPHQVNALLVSTTSQNNRLNRLNGLKRFERLSLPDTTLEFADDVNTMKADHPGEGSIVSSQTT